MHPTFEKLKTVQSEYSQRFKQCVAKYIIITKATKVWMTFIPFMNDIWGKTIFEAFSSSNKYIESVWVGERISHL